MNDDSLITINQLQELIKLSHRAAFARHSRTEAYVWISHVLGKFRYFAESKKHRGIIKAYIRTMTGYSDAQADRLIQRKKKLGHIKPRERTQPTFPCLYTPADIALIAAVDNAEGRRTGGALQKTLRDMYHVYGDQRFARLSRISIAHLYNLRGTNIYRSRSATYKQTPSVSIPIGLRQKPQPHGQPGYLRVDSVHQGDLDKQKGLYHINLVDEVTQSEVVITVEGISERWLIPALEAALEQFPFVIVGFHSDNGSEFINTVVAKLLNRLMINQTKSRARRTNDNALVEGKNGAVVRRHFGFAHIPKTFAAQFNEFNRRYLNPYLFFHRPCAFADEIIDARGKIKKIYRTYLTPCEKLLSLPNVTTYLKPGVTPGILRAMMMAKTHLAAAEELQAAKDILFKEIHRSMVH